MIALLGGYRFAVGICSKSRNDSAIVVHFYYNEAFLRTPRLLRVNLPGQVMCLSRSSGMAENGTCGPEVGGGALRDRGAGPPSAGAGEIGYVGIGHVASVVAVVPPGTTADRVSMWPLGVCPFGHDGRVRRAYTRRV